MCDARPVDQRTWDLAAARNEVESCQLVLRSEKAVRDVKVSLSPIRHVKTGAKLPATLFRVDYVQVDDTRTAYPDPLPPLTIFDLEPGKAQLVWISVRVPVDAPAGSYETSVKIEADSVSFQMPLSVHVWDFALPVTPSCVTAFGVSFDDLAKAHGVDKSSARLRRIYMKYYEFMLDHRISPFSIPVDLMSKEAARYLNDPRMTSFAIPVPKSMPTSYHMPIKYELNLPDDDAELGRVVERMVDNGWFGKSFFYTVDEPRNIKAYDELDVVAKRLQAINPQCRLMVPFFCNPDDNEERSVFDLLNGKARIWCPETCLLDNLNHWNSKRKPDTRCRAEIIKRKKAGEAAWWYVCCGPGLPYCNMFVEMPALAHRALFWQQKMEGIDGLLYWNTTGWSLGDKCQSKWDNLNAYPPAGDGVLVYPGSTIGTDEPVSSIRAELVRDGIEDFDYLTLADKLLGPEVTREFVARITTSLTQFEQDPAKFEAVRRELGAGLEKAVKAR